MSKGTLTNSLFRQQAIDEQKDRLYGDVILKQPFAFSLITLFIFLLVCSIAILLIYGSYSRKENVSGYLVPDKGLVKIYAPVKGILIKRHINEGQTVVKDELLFTISTIHTDEHGDDTDAMLLSELERQKSSLKKKIQQEKFLNENRQDAVRDQIAGINHEISQLQQSTTLQTKQLKLLSDQKIKLQQLYSKGHIPDNTLQQSKQLYLEKQLVLQSIKQQKVQLENRRDDLVHQLKRLPVEWSSRLSDLNKILSDIEQQIVTAAGRRNYSIRAPVSGHLTALQISEGQMLNTHSPLLAILPTGTSLRAELFLPTRAAGFVAREQKVLLRYQAFPYQHYGMHGGYVTSIAQVILAPSELPIPVALQEPVYRVQVIIEKQTVRAFGQEFPLQAGMLLDADIVLEARTLGQWLLEPIYGLAGNI